MAARLLVKTHLDNRHFSSTVLKETSLASWSSWQTVFWSSDSHNCVDQIQCRSNACRPIYFQSKVVESCLCLLDLYGSLYIRHFKGSFTLAISKCNFELQFYCLLVCHFSWNCMQVRCVLSSRGHTNIFQNCNIKLHLKIVRVNYP
jgi:hypothetical protein